jgi:hypothetical protein
MLLRSVTLAVFCFAGFLFAQGSGDWDEHFPPNNVIGNVYYVGTKGIS